MEQDTPAGKPHDLRSRLRENWLSVLGIILVIGIVGAILGIYFASPGIIDELQGYGYLGAFVTSIILNATVLLPVSNMAIIVSLGAALPIPLFVGAAGGLGAGIGEMTGYVLGRSGRGLLAGNKMYARVEGWVKRWGWLAVFILSIVPFVFDVVGIIAGALRMPTWRFFLACWAGRTISYTAAAYLGRMWLKDVPWWGYLAGMAIAAAIVFILCRRQKSGGDGPA